MKCIWFSLNSKYTSADNVELVPFFSIDLRCAYTFWHWQSQVKVKIWLWTMNGVNFVIDKINNDSTAFSPILRAMRINLCGAQRLFEILRRSFTELYKSFCLFSWHLFLFSMLASLLLPLWFGCSVRQFDHDFACSLYFLFGWPQAHWNRACTQNGSITNKYKLLLSIKPLLCIQDWGTTHTKTFELEGDSAKTIT